jgi:multiple sugar transport system substrate-binding protein
MNSKGENMQNVTRRMVNTMALAGALVAPRIARAKTTITFWTFFNPQDKDPRSQAVKGIIDGFEAANPDIAVNVETINWGKIGSLAIQAEAAGGGPDVIQIFSNQLTQHVKAGSIASLDPFIADWAAKNQDDYLIRLQDLQYDGKVMALPWELRVLSALYYRKDLLDAAGLPVPRTLDEVSTTARKLATDRVNGFAVGLSETMLASALVEMFDPLIGSYGGTLLDKDGHAAFNSAAGQQALGWIVNLYRTGAMSKSAVTMNYEDITAGFKAGTIAMAFHGTDRIGSVRSAPTIGPTIHMTLMPGVQPDKPAPVLIAGQTLAIGANSKVKPEAWRFIDYYLSPQAQLLSAKAQMGPVCKSVYDDLFFKTPEGQELVQWRDAIAKYGVLHHYPEDFPRLCQLLARAAQAAVLTNVPVKQALDDAAEKYDADL